MATGTPDPRSSMSRHLLGFSMLVLTMLSGYMASRMVAPEETRQVADDPARLDAHIREAATLYGFSDDLVVAIIETESQFNTHAVSRRGAQGLMQLTPATAAILGVDDPFDPRANIHGGVRHLRGLMDRFDNNLTLALAAYNAGERAVLNYRGVPPYRETRQYVSRILQRLAREGARTSDPSQRERRL
jgi:soluble lytic murein transglycosylase-like protein